MRPARDRWINPALALCLCTAAGAAFAWLRLPLPWMIGPLAAMALCNFAGAGLRAQRGGREAGQIVIGTTLGLASVALAMVVAAGFAALLAWGSGLPVASLVLATAPGGIAEMCITAKVLQLGVPLVTAAHVTRVLVLISTTGPSYRLARALRARFRSS
jgi:hypothetical protein